MPNERRFKTQHDCARAIANTYRKLERDEIDPTKARTLIYGALSISGILREADLEERIGALEALMGKKGAA